MARLLPFRLHAFRIGFVRPRVVSRNRGCVASKALPLAMNLAMEPGGGDSLRESPLEPPVWVCSGRNADIWLYVEITTLVMYERRLYIFGF